MGFGDPVTASKQQYSEHSQICLYQLINLTAPTTYLLKSGSWSQGPDLPIGLAFHELVATSRNEVFIVLAAPNLILVDFLMTGQKHTCIIWTLKRG